MARIAYLRVSSDGQSTESQRQAMGGTFDKVFTDEGVSGGVLAAQRPGFASMLAYVREGDTLSVYAIDRLGRDAIDVQQTVRNLREKGVAVEVHGLGVIAEGVGDLILAVLAQVAQMERARINERTASGREVAKRMLAETGRTQHGKTSLGRPAKADAAKVRAWRAENKASIAQAAEHFSLSTATVKRYCKDASQN